MFIVVVLKMIMNNDDGGDDDDGGGGDDRGDRVDRDGGEIKVEYSVVGLVCPRGEDQISGLSTM